MNYCHVSKRTTNVLSPNQTKEGEVLINLVYTVKVSVITVGILQR